MASQVWLGSSEVATEFCTGPGSLELGATSEIPMKSNRPGMSSSRYRSSRSGSVFTVCWDMR
jgi:hypothetical protein